MEEWDCSRQYGAGIEKYMSYYMKKMDIREWIARK